MWRNVAGVLIAGAVGLHCSAPSDPTDSVSSESAQTARGGDGDGERRATPASPSPSDEPSSPKRSVGPDLRSIVHDGAAPDVTSSVIDEHGATFATGTFVGTVGIGHTYITSRGEADVFLLKIDPAGAVEWVLAIGSASAERAPRVALDGESVTVIGMTKGEMNCGSGPLPTWSSDFFFLCMFAGLDGETQSGGVFPTGNP